MNKGAVLAVVRFCVPVETTKVPTIAGVSICLR
jgi:hypothetical protein